MVLTLIEEEMDDTKVKTTDLIELTNNVSKLNKNIDENAEGFASKNALFLLMDKLLYNNKGDSENISVTNKQKGDGRPSI